MVIRTVVYLQAVVFIQPLPFTFRSPYGHVIDLLVVVFRERGAVEAVVRGLARHEYTASAAATPRVDTIGVSSELKKRSREREPESGNKTRRARRVAEARAREEAAHVPVAHEV